MIRGLSAISKSLNKTEKGIAYSSEVAGDVSPTTVPGKILTCCFMLLTVYVIKVRVACLNSQKFVKLNLVLGKTNTMS